MANICFSLALCSLFLFLAIAIALAADQSPPTMFILGDSTADVGTNTLIPLSHARADFPHNGVDFPNRRPTGRFSNGYNSADFVG